MPVLPTLIAAVDRRRTVPAVRSPASAHGGRCHAAAARPARHSPRVRAEDPATGSATIRPLRCYRSHPRHAGPRRTHQAFIAATYHDPPPRPNERAGSVKPKDCGQPARSPTLCVASGACPRTPTAEPAECAEFPACTADLLARSAARPADGQGCEPHVAADGRAGPVERNLAPATGHHVGFTPDSCASSSETRPSGSARPRTATPPTATLPRRPSAVHPVPPGSRAPRTTPPPGPRRSATV